MKMALFIDPLSLGNPGGFPTNMDSGKLVYPTIEKLNSFRRKSPPPDPFYSFKRTQGCDSGLKHSISDKAKQNNIYLKIKRVYDRGNRSIRFPAIDRLVAKTFSEMWFPTHTFHVISRLTTRTIKLTRNYATTI